MSTLVGASGLFASDDAEPQFAGSGVLATSAPTILFDGKTLNADNVTELWQNVGTGTFTFQTNKSLMEVTAGQYAIRQSRRVMPYYSGYPAVIEMTCDNFHTEAGVVKRAGYFSSSPVAPHTANLDGFALEDDGTQKRLKVWNNGAVVYDVPETDWVGRLRMAARNPGYDWSKFNVLMFDFLWLGGAVLRLWLRVGDRWQLLHAVALVGSKDDVIFKSPQQFVRYEMISTTGIGTFRPICSQVSVLGDVSQNGYLHSAYNEAMVSGAVTNTTYVLQALRKRVAFRDLAVELQRIAVVRAGPGDIGQLLLLRNPTVSGALTYNDYGKIARALGTGQTVSADGEVLIAIPAGDTALAPVPGNYRRWMTQTITDTFDEYVLAYRTRSGNQSVSGMIDWTEHG